MSNTYYKITNQKEIHHGFQYKEGLNVLKDEFVTDDKVSCGKGGLYFTDAKNLHVFVDYGIHIRTITLPMEDPSLKVVRVEGNDNGKKYTKWRANKIILGKRYYLLDPDVVKQFKLPVTEYYMDTLSDIGDTETLDKWLNSSKVHKYSVKCVDNALKNENFKILNWWKNSGLPLKLSSEGVQYCTAHNQIGMLKWLSTNNIKITFKKSQIRSHLRLFGTKETIAWWLKNYNITPETVKY